MREFLATGSQLEQKIKGTSKYHQLASEKHLKAYQETVQHMYVYIYIYVCICIYIYIYIYIYN